MKLLKLFAFVLITMTAMMAADLENADEDKWYNPATFDIHQWYSSNTPAIDPKTGLDLRVAFKRKMPARYENIFDENGQITVEAAEELHTKIKLFPVTSQHTENDMIKKLLVDAYGKAIKNKTGIARFIRWSQE